MKTYKLHVANEEAELAMLKLIKACKYRGLYWPESSKSAYNFEIDVDEDDLIFLMLQVPCQLHTT